MQRISERVIILNHGELIAQGSVEELLSASQGLSYHLVLKGDGETCAATFELISMGKRCDHGAPEQLHRIECGC